MAIGLGITKVLVVGASKTGLAVTQALADESVAVTLVDDANTPEAEVVAQRAADLGAEVQLGDLGDDLLEGAELVVPTPAIPPHHRLLALALREGIPIWSEIELAWRFRKGPILAVTGTNGKTTVTMLLTAMLNEGGFAAMAAGNIGYPLITAARGAEKGSVIVAEVSSFQLRFASAFSPSVAVVLNVADDHYDWHEGFDDYVEAKAKITASQSPDDHLVVRARDEGCARIGKGSRARLVAFGLEPPAAIRERVAADTGRYVELGAGIDANRLTLGSEVRDFDLMRTADIRLSGPHNLENVLAAAAAAAVFGVDAGSIARAAGTFEAPPHRMTFVANKEGVAYIDDSKATNPHAAVSAISGCDRVVLIAGGQSRGIDLAPLSEVRDKVKALVAMGETAQEVAAFFAGVPTRLAKDVEEAVALAAGLAEPGDTVLLSPAFPSQDQYRDYAERGERFARAVLG